MILYITYDGLTDPLGQSQIIPYLVSLAGNGYNISILSVEKKENFQDSNLRDDTDSILKKANINWHYIIYSKKPPVIATLWDIIKLRRKANKIVKRNTYKIVHCRSYIPSLIGVYLKKRKNLKYIFDMRGFYADERVDGNIWNQNNPVFRRVYKYFKKKEQQFIKQADAIVSLTDAARDIIRKWNVYQENPAPISVIPCCVDTNHFSYKNITDDDKKNCRYELGVRGNDFVISYIGSLGTWYMVEEMLHFFKRLLLQIPSAKFLFITQSNPEMIYRYAEKYKIFPQYIIIKPAPRSMMPYYISISNVSIFFIKPVFSKKASSPTKFAELLAMGIPVICNANIGDLDTCIRDFRLGIILHLFKPESYDMAIKDMEQFLPAEPYLLREVCKNLFSLEKGVELYEAIYQKLD